MFPEETQKLSTNEEGSLHPFFLDKNGQMIPKQQDQEYIRRISGKQSQNNHRKRLTVGLSKKNEANDLLHYQRLKVKPYECQLPQDIVEPILEEMKRQKLDQIDANPEDYFNFGFDRAAFQTYLMLMVLRRAQRENLCKNVGAVHAHLRKLILKKQFLNSDEPKIHFNPESMKQDVFD